MSELQTLLTEFAAAKLGLLERHEASARIVGHYDYNNTYQNVISREETHLSWLQAALAGYGVSLPPVAAAALPAPEAPKEKKRVEASAYRSLLDDDARYLGAFVESWRPRVENMSHARHRTLLNVILGESMEHKHLFAQAAQGFENLLGRRTAGSDRVGAVLPTRWLE